jgi:hypothetical protein
MLYKIWEGGVRCNRIKEQKKVINIRLLIPQYVIGWGNLVCFVFPLPYPIKSLISRTIGHILPDLGSIIQSIVFCDGQGRRLRLLAVENRTYEDSKGHKWTRGHCRMAHMYIDDY